MENVLWKTDIFNITLLFHSYLIRNQNQVSLLHFLNQSKVHFDLLHTHYYTQNLTTHLSGSIHGGNVDNDVFSCIIFKKCLYIWQHTLLF